MKWVFVIGSILFVLNGCSSVNSIVNPDKVSLVSKETQLESRQYQTQKFKTSGMKLMKAVIETLQDDNFIIKHSDSVSGLISAEKMESDIKLELSAHVKPIVRNLTQLRLNVLMVEQNFFGAKSESSLKKKYYKYIFSRIEKTIFLENNLYNAQRPSKNYYNYGY